MDYLKILATAQVSKICIAIRREELDEYKTTIESNPDRDVLLEDWMGKNPTSSFTPKAMAHLKKIAAEIARFETEST
jgi:hypothetical protein